MGLHNSCWSSINQSHQFHNSQPWTSINRIMHLYNFEVLCPLALRTREVMWDVIVGEMGLNDEIIWIKQCSKCVERCQSNLVYSKRSRPVNTITTEAYIRHWLMQYYLDLVKFIARYEIIIAWYEIIKTCYAKIITLYAILQQNNAIFITKNGLIKF